MPLPPKIPFRDQVYGVLALWIVFFHLSYYIPLEWNIPLVTNFFRLGDAAVDIFLLISGYCITLSLGKDASIRRFYNSRLKRILLSYLIIAIPYFAWKHLLVSHSSSVLKYLYDLSGASFLYGGILSVWFVIAILLMYLCAPLFYRIIKRSLPESLLLFAGVILAVIAAHFALPVFRKSEIAWTRFPVFILGMIIGRYFPSLLTQRNKYAWAASAVFVLALLIVPYKAWVSEAVGTFGLRLSYLLIVIPFFFFLHWAFLFFPKAIHAPAAKIGRCSLEIYLIHYLLIKILKYYGLLNVAGYWGYLIIPVISILLAAMTVHFVQLATDNRKNNTASHEKN